MPSIPSTATPWPASSGQTTTTRPGSPAAPAALSGVNPVARLHGLPISFGGSADGLAPLALFDKTVQIADLLLDEKESGRLGDLRVLNFSIASPRGTSVLLSGAQVRHANRAFRRVAERFARDRILIVQAAGNSSIPATDMASFAWAGANWTSPLPNPVLVVEAIDFSAGLTTFSNTGGDVSAPGLAIWTTGFSGGCDGHPSATVAGSVYCEFPGTSMAAPFAAGLAGYLLAFAPDLELPGLRRAIVDWARADTTGARPRIDAFASLLSLPGAVRALADVNDATPDGNRRLNLGPNGVPAGDVPADPSGYRTQPDGVVDMRDFRPFRDAWLQVCRDALSPEPGCPPAASIVLDGDLLHPKKDLNLDGCLWYASTATECVTPDDVFPRFDFNGDGLVSRDARARVPLRADGSLADSPGESTEQTDLGVFAGQFERDPARAEGWTFTRLPDLLISGDLEVHAADLFPPDAPATLAAEVTVRRLDTSETLPVRRLTGPEGVVVVTAPVAPEGTRYQVRGAFDLGTERLESLPSEVTLRPGEDKRVDLCAARFGLTADRDRLPADGAATATLTGTVAVCRDDPAIAADVPVTFSLQPQGPGHAALVPAAPRTDSEGKIRATFTAGTVQDTYLVTATADLGGGRTVVGRFAIQTTPGLTIAYAWRQTTLEWREEGGTTDWNPQVPCGSAGDSPAEEHNCIQEYRAALDPTLPAPQLERSGTLRPGADGRLILTERLSQDWNQYQVRYKWWGDGPDAAPQTAHPAARSLHPGVRDHALPPSVSAVDGPSGVRLNGLQSIAELHYPVETNSVIEQFTGGSFRFRFADFYGQSAIRPELLMVPRGDGSALRFADDVGQPVTLPAARTVLWPPTRTTALSSATTSSGPATPASASDTTPGRATPTT